MARHDSGSVSVEITSNVGLTWQNAVHSLVSTTVLNHLHAAHTQWQYPFAGDREHGQILNSQPPPAWPGCNHCANFSLPCDRVALLSSIPGGRPQHRLQ